MAEQKWFEGLRRQIKHRCGPGWGIDERHGGVRLTRRIAAGKQHKNPRQTVQLGIPWNPAHSGDIFLVVCQIRERMENGEESLAKAFQLQQKQHGSTPTVSKSVEDEDSGWQAVIDDFIDRRRQVNRATTMRDLSCHMKRVLKTLEKKPRPQSGADLMRAYARQHFKHCRPGGSGRVVQLNNVRALLRYAIKEYGYDSRWKPLETDDLRELIGTVMMRPVHSLSWDNDRVQDELITWQIAKDNGNKPIRNGGAKGFKKAIAALEEQGLGERLQVGTVWAFKASKPWP